MLIAGFVSWHTKSRRPDSGIWAPAVEALAAAYCYCDLLVALSAENSEAVRFGVLIDADPEAVSAEGAENLAIFCRFQYTTFQKKSQPFSKIIWFSSQKNYKKLFLEPSPGLLSVRLIELPGEVFDVVIVRIFGPFAAVLENRRVLRCGDV